MSDYILGFDIGGTKCAVVLGRVSSAEVEILDRRQFATRTDLGSEQALLKLEESTREIVADNNLSVSRVKVIGISCGGPLDSRLGLIVSPPNLPGWDEIHITDRFEKTFALPVRLQNDANACALAEWKWGAGRHTRNMIFLTFGTGLGAGLILDGKLYTGTNEMAGEVGHVRVAEQGPIGYGKSGSFEGFCSGGGIAQIARQVVTNHWSRGESVAFCACPNDLDGLNAQTVGDAARSGDPVALEIFKLVGEKLGQGLAALIDILNPEVIVIGSIFARQRELLWPAAESVIKSEALASSAAVCKVVPAALGESIGDYASLSVAASYLEE